MNDTSLSLWLNLREQADWAARSLALTQAIASTVPRDRPVCVLDLGTGEGSNFRYLADVLPAHQHWLLIDRSHALLSNVGTRTRAWAAERGHPLRSEATGFRMSSEALDCRVDMRAQDLRTLHDPALFAGRHLVTASALLDLVSERWLRTLAARCRVAGAAALFTITYNGGFSCVPAEPEDELVRELINRHQRRDKGLGGPAEGPAAAACAARCFVDEGYRVETEGSDWVLGPDEAPIQRAVIDGWAEAAREMAPHETQTIASWQARRSSHVDAGRSRIMVGHRDVAAWREP